MDPDRLRVALLVYRGNPHSGGQGVYTRYLARELVDIGHQVTVFAGQPWPVLDDGTGFVGVPSLDLYRQSDPFRFPRLSQLRSVADLAELAIMASGGFPEPRTFSWRVRRILAGQRGRFDVLHDNQTFGSGMLDLMAEGWPLLGTCHHPITVDRTLELAHAANWRRAVSLRRWYGFLAMQKRVAASMTRIVTVSESSKRDIVEQMGIAPERLAVVPIGVDHERFRPRPEVAAVPGRIMTTASADVALKGLVPLLEALAALRVEAPEAHLVVVGRLRDDSPVPKVLAGLGLDDGAVRFVSGVSDEEMVRLYAEAAVVAVPSLYEGFSLPAVEAMASGTPLVATTGGALPEVVGSDGGAGLLVPPGDPAALAGALGAVLADPGLAARLAAAGRRRVLERFTWRACALATVEHYREVIDETARRDASSRRAVPRRAPAGRRSPRVTPHGPTPTPLDAASSARC